MSDRHAKIFLTVTAMYFLIRDTSVVMMVYNSRKQEGGDRCTCRPRWWTELYRRLSKGGDE